MPRVTLSLPLHPPDPRVLHIVGVLKTIALTATVALSAIVLWFRIVAPGGQQFAGAFPPDTWIQTSYLSAFCALLCVLSLVLSRPRRSLRAVLLSRGLAGLVLVLSILQIVTYLYASDPAIRTDRAIPQTAAGYLFLSALMLCLRVERPALSSLVDGLTAFTCTLTLVFFYSYLLNTLHLVPVLNVSDYTRISPPTILSLTLLTFVAFNQRAECGLFSVLFHPGIAGKTARFAGPFALILPLMRSIGRGRIHAEYVTALSSFAAFFLLLLVCTRIIALEKEVRNLSLRDELTGLYNRRGFNLLADQAHRLARRSEAPFSILFLDMDNLKQINDALGHEAGSEVLRQMASLLYTTFRDTDVIGRLGGDEFVVAGRIDAQAIERATVRLIDAAGRLALAQEPASQPPTVQNSFAQSPRTQSPLTQNPVTQNPAAALSFSFGHVTSDAATPHTLEQMLQIADQRMYETKRRKKEATRNSLVERFNPVRVQRPETITQQPN